VDTPEFLIWAIEFTCPIRGTQNGSDPERTERQLRAARALSDAQREGRVLDGLCIDGSDGFRIDLALAIYGGLTAVERACSHCPANSPADETTLAGCFGVLPFDSTQQSSLASIEDVLAEPSFASKSQQLFPLTQPRWYGLWINSPLHAEQIELLIDALNAANITAREFSHVHRGLATSLKAHLPFHAALYPPGRVEGTVWKLKPHCPRCKASSQNAAARRCATCGLVGHPAPDKKRKARGRRPYFPLDRLLGPQQAAEFLLKYEAYRKQQEATPPAQTPRQPEPPDNPPAH
jgi:hypothetical protein